MKRQLLVLAMAIVVAFGVAGCGQSSQAGQSGQSASGSEASVSASASAAAQEAQPQPLVIEESGYTVTDHGYVMYGFKLTNPNKNFGALFPTVQITGKSADGKVIFSDDQVLMQIYPGESITYGTQAGNGTAPDKVEFTAKVNSKNWKNTDAKREGLYTLENLNANGSNYGMSSYTGEITLNKEDEEATKPAITLIMRDKSGAIVYGYTTYLMSELSVGVPTAFEVNAYEVPDSAVSFEVSATPWM